MLTRDEAQKIAQKVLGLSTFPECHVTITSQEQAYTRFANNGITTASFALRHSLSIVATRDGKIIGSNPSMSAPRLSEPA